jgi:hypothetical protein
VPVEGTPLEIAFNSSSTYGAVLDFQGRLLLYRISPTTGEPLLHASAPTWPRPFAVTFAASDRFILVPSYDRHVVSTYDFDESTGQVTWRVDSPVGTKPTSIACTSLRIWSIGTLLEITWEPIWFSSAWVKIELSRDSGITWETIFADSQNDGKEMWGITGPATQQARIKVCNSDDSSTCAFTAESIIR